jgi:hypothetical protein
LRYETLEGLLFLKMENTQLTKASLKVISALHTEIVSLPPNKFGSFLFDLKFRRELLNNLRTSLKGTSAHLARETKQTEDFILFYFYR